MTRYAKKMIRPEFYASLSVNLWMTLNLVHRLMYKKGKLCFPFLFYTKVIFIYEEYYAKIRPHLFRSIKFFSAGETPYGI